MGMIQVEAKCTRVKVEVVEGKSKRFPKEEMKLSPAYEILK